MSSAQDYWNALNDGRYVKGYGNLSWDQLGAACWPAVENYYNNTLLPSVLGKQRDPLAYGPPRDDYVLTPNTWGDDWYTSHYLGVHDPTKLNGYTGENVLPQASLLYAIAPDVAQSLGITQDQALRLAQLNDSANTTAAADDASASNKQGWIMAASTIGTGAGLGLAGYGDAAAGAGAYSAGMGGGVEAGGAGGAAGGAGGAAGGASSAADDAALDAIVNDTMSQSWTAADQVAVDSAGGSAFTDPTTGLQYDSSGLGQGTSSGSSSSWTDTLKGWAKNANTAKTIAGMLSGSSNGGSGGGGGFDVGSPASYAPSGSVSSGGAGGSAGMTLENPTSSYAQLSSPAQQQSNQFGLIDVSPASNAFNMAGATWNQRMANALRGK